jgi:hypothetical protein
MKILESITAAAVISRPKLASVNPFLTEKIS